MCVVDGNQMEPFRVERLLERRRPQFCETKAQCVGCAGLSDSGDRTRLASRHGCAPGHGHLIPVGYADPPVTSEHAADTITGTQSVGPEHTILFLLVGRKLAGTIRPLHSTHACTCSAPDQGTGCGPEGSR